MSQKFIYLPSEFDTCSSHDVGTYAKEFEQLNSLGITIPKMIVIPQNTLKVIAQANNLQAKIYKLVQETNFSSRLSKNKTKRHIKHLIYSQRIPKELASQLLDNYHKYFKQSFVLVKNAELLSTSDTIVENVHSDANFIDAILETWALLSVEKYLRLLSRTHSTHEILFPSPLLVIEQIEPDISGTAFTFNTTSGNKNQITIQSRWGVFDNSLQHDTYFVDVRTLNTVNKHIQTKESQLRRVIGKLTKDSVIKKNKESETLNPELLKEITTITSAIKKKYLSQLKINWSIKKGTLYIDSVNPVDVTASQTSQTQIATKQLFTVTTNLKPKKLSKDVSGSVIYSAGQLLSITATHPMEVAKTKQKNHLITAISKSLTKYSKASEKPLIYRANNFTSKQFNKLSFSTLYETEELNPSLGFRGGLRYISQQNAFKIELDILNQTLQNTKSRIVLLLPFIRSPEELVQVYQLIKNSGLTNHPHFSVWLELSTPENVLNLEAYPLQLINGVVFNTQSIHSLLTGVDISNKDIYTRYSHNIVLLKQLVLSAIKQLNEKTKTLSIHEKPELFVDISIFNREFFEELSSLDISGFIINETVTEIVKKCMIEGEYNSVL
jgi:phosphoenolpyruvate synthase/pyruvate phosphate dikinase